MKSSWFKLGLASLVLACSGLAAGLSACSGDDNNKNDGGGPDGSPADTGPNDTGTMPDTGADSGPLDCPKDPEKCAKLITVHASPQLWGIRFCFAVNGSVTPLPPLPHDPATQPATLGYPGIPPGAGGAVPFAGTDLTPLTITPYIIDAYAIRTHFKGETPSEKKCSDLIGPDGGVGITEGTDYWKLGDIPANTFQHNRTYMLVLEGCTKDANFGSTGLTTAMCGSGWNATSGNLTAKVYGLDRATGAKMGAQFVHASPILMVPHPGGAIGSLATVAGLPDGGTLVDIINLTPATNGGNIEPATATQVTGANVATTYLSMSLIESDAGIGANPLLPISAVEMLTTGLAPDGGSMYKAGGNYTFVMVGDPMRIADGGPSLDPDGGAPKATAGAGYSFHALGFPNNPPVVLLQ